MFTDMARSKYYVWVFKFKLRKLNRVVEHVQRKLRRSINLYKKRLLYQKRTLKIALNSQIPSNVFDDILKDIFS